MNFKKHLLLLLFAFILFPVFSYSQDEISEKPKYAPHGERHRNVTDAKGKQGLWKLYSRDRILLSEINYKNDIKHGACTKYYSSTGVMHEESNYYYGQKDGEYKNYFINGQINSEGSYKNGRKTGEWITYNKSSGEKKSEGNYVENEKDGVWIYYDMKGTKTSSGSYVHGVKEGDWESFDEEGKVIATSKYVNGVVQLKEKNPSNSTTTTPKKPKFVPYKKTTTPNTTPNTNPNPNSNPNPNTNPNPNPNNPGNDINNLNNNQNQNNKQDTLKTPDNK
ncbi:MAG: toxin-antitoxin system YwqK family antitoxin [Bacteroidales bacterium]